MKKRRKHSAKKRHATYSRALLSSLKAVIIWVAGQNNSNCLLVSLTTGDTIRVDSALAGAIGEVQHDWAIFCGAFGRKQDGTEYMKGETVTAERCFQHNLADQLNDLHQDLLDGMNPMHTVGAGWIACPWGKVLTESEAGELFAKFGAWDNERLEVEKGA